MIAHKPSGPMQPVVIGGVPGGGGAGAHMPMRPQQQQQQQQQQPQMVGQHHHQQQQHLLQEPANYYANAATNERFAHVEQVYHTQDPQAARFAPGRPQQQQQYQPQHVLQQDHHHHQHQHQHQHQQPQQQHQHLQHSQLHQQQHQQQQHLAQTQVPSQIQYQAPTSSTSGYSVVEQPGRFQGVNDQTQTYNGGVISQQAGLNYRGANHSANHSVRVQQQQQQPSQLLQRPPSYANNQQQTPVRPIDAQNNRLLGRHQQQNYQEQKATMSQSQINTPVINNNQHYLQSTGVSGYQSQTMGPHHLQQQDTHQHHPTAPANYGGNATTIEEYSSNSPNLLQQHLNRKQQQRLAPAQQPQQSQPVPALSQAPIQRPQGANFGPRNRAPMQVAGPPPQQQHVNRFCSEPVDGHMEFYQAMPAEQVNQGQRVQSGGGQVSGPSYYQQPIASRGQHQHQQQQQQQQQPQAQRPQMIRQPNQITQQQHQQLRPIPVQMPLDTASHLVGNPTPPLTPIAPSAPLMRPPNANLAVTDEWSLHQQSHQHAHVNHDQMQQQPCVPAGYSNGPGGSGGMLTDGGINKQLAPHHLHHQSHNHHHHNHHQTTQSQPRALNNNGLPSSIGSQQTQQRVLTTMPKTTNNSIDSSSIQYQGGANMQQQHHQSHHQHGIQPHSVINSIPTLQAPTIRPSVMPIDQQQKHQNQVLSTQMVAAQTEHTAIRPHHKPHLPSSSSSATSLQAATSDQQSTRLTLPLRDAALLEPFRLDHDAQFTTKIFHINQQLYETLSKSAGLVNPKAATVIQELQFRAYLIDNPTAKSGGESLLASNNHHPLSANKSCHWPELLQISVNQQVVQLDRSCQSHKAVDIFQLCHLGDNVLDIQVKGCYCTHEFVLEAVERPTLKAFMNSCFKSRLLSQEACLQKLKYNFGSPGFLVQNSSLQSLGIFNEYISVNNQTTPGEQTRVKISLRCPITAKRIRTPIRGHNCKHLQCFDLENFLFLNSDRSQWNCPICSVAIAFNMLELDQHQMNIAQSIMSDPTMSTVEDILLDCNGQWLAYFNGQQQAQTSRANLHNVIDQHSPQQQHQHHSNTAKSNGTFHPQASSFMPSGSPTQTSTTRPMNGTSFMGPAGSSMIAAGGGGGPVLQSNPAALNWDSQHIAQQQQQPSLNEPSGNFIPTPPTTLGGPIRRPASANQPVTGRRSASGSPLAKRPYAGRYASPQPQPSVSQFSAHSAPIQPHQTTPVQPLKVPQITTPSIGDELSPLAAMERTIIQHEQQMGPPPFDPSSLGTANQLRTGSGSAATTSAGGSAGGAGQPAPVAQAAAPASLLSSHSSPITSPATGVGGGGSGSNSLSLAPQASSIAQPSPEAGARSASVCGSNFSPNPHVLLSPASTRTIPASPQQIQQQFPPQSPAQQQQQHQPNISTSKPATPSSTLLIHGGPETPATPSNSMQHQQQHSHQQQQHFGSSTIGGGGGGVDHQPLSNGSASAGSITSSSTMTPSGQSLGSVGMGGDSRCNTAPLQNNPSLDDIVLAGSSGGGVASSQISGGGCNVGGNQHIHGTLDDKNEILMNKLMMEPNESVLHRNSELTLALEEAEWKQQLDRGKSEHLANFLNEPLMNKKHHEHSPLERHHNHQKHHHLMSSSSSANIEHLNGPGAKMLSGGLNPSDDEGNHSHGSSPGGDNMDQLDQFAGYLDADAADDGAGLPPDDSILDLFER